MSFYKKEEPELEYEKSTSYPAALDTEKASIIAHEGIIVPEEIEGTASVLSSTANMLKTIVGAAIITLPFALTFYGYVLGTLLMVISALASFFGLYLFELCASRLGRKSSPFSVAAITVPQAAYVLDVLIALKSLGVGLSYLLIMARLMMKFIKGFGDENVPVIFEKIQIWLAIFAIPIIGLSFLSKMDYLRYSSYLGMLCVFYLVGLSFYDAGSSSITSSTWFKPFPADFQKESLAYFSLFVFAFTCHQNLFPIHNEAKNNSVRSITTICAIAISIAFVVYMSFGMVSFARYADDLRTRVNDKYRPSIFDHLPTTWPYQVARVLFSFVLAFSYPLQVLPFRNSVTKLLPLKEEAKKRYRSLIFICVTTFMILFDFGIGMLDPDLGPVMSLVGSVTSSVICYVLPALFYYKLKADQPFDTTKILAVVLGVFGVFVFLICTGASIYNFF